MDVLTPESATISVAEALALPELVAGKPEVVAAQHRLDRRLRWAHVIAGADAAPLLDGGELLLCTGAGWPTDRAPLQRVTDGLVNTGPAGIIFELGPHFAAVPDALVDSCRRAEVPLIVLHRVVRFVQVTQRVHQRLLAAQNEELAARSEVHAMLTELGLNRSPVDYVVQQLAETLDATVVLEDSAHRVVAWSGRGLTPALALAPWSAAAGRTPLTKPGWERVPVEARGTRWGHLTALPGEPHPAGRRTVLELGAFALALARLDDEDDSEWMRFSSKRLFDTLLEGRYRSGAELSVQLSAAGLPIDGRRLFAATLAGVDDFGGHESLERAILETALRRAIAPEGRALITAAEGGRSLLALFSLPDKSPSATAASRTPLEAQQIIENLDHELSMLLPRTVPAAWRAHLCLSAPAGSLRQTIAALEQVNTTGRLPAATRVGRVTAQQAEKQRLAYLVRGLAGSPELQEFTEAVIGPLIAYDRDHDGDLLRVLGAYLAHPTNRSLAAQRSLLSRSVFYQRLTLIEQLLEVDLADGETIASLTVAMLAQRPE